jgi:hypothetical protein
LARGFGALLFCRRAPDGSIPAKQLRLHPLASLILPLANVSYRRVRLTHLNIIARPRGHITTTEKNSRPKPLNWALFRVRSALHSAGVRV